MTRIDGYYKFDINFSDPSCPSGGSYAIDVIPPTPGYETGFSRVIPPPDAAAPPFNVPTCPAGPDDAIPTTTDFCELQTSEFAPARACRRRAAARRISCASFSTAVGCPVPVSCSTTICPVDPTLTGIVTITKTTPMVNVTRGQMVPYVISVKNTWDFPLTDVDVVDRYPVGFKYVEGSARFDDQPLEPTVADGQTRLVASDAGRQGRAHDQAAARAGRRRHRRQVHELCARAAQLDRPGIVGSGERNRAHRAGPDVRLYRRHRQGIRRHNRNGMQDDGEDGNRRCATRVADGPRGANGFIRSLPHHVRDHAARRSRQQLHAEARRPLVADRLPRIDRRIPDPAGNAR